MTSSNCNYLLKAPSTNNITLGVKISTEEFREDTNIQFITGEKKAVVIIKGQNNEP